METVDIIKVETKQAETSIKQLRAQLKAYKDEMAGLEEGSSAFLTVATKAGAVKHQIDEINKSVRGASADIDDMLSTVTQIGAGVSAAFAGAVGVMQLMGVESEETTKAIQKLQALMAIPAGLLGIDAAIKAMDRFQNALKTTDSYLAKIKEKSANLWSDTNIGERLNKLYKKAPEEAKEILSILRESKKAVEEEGVALARLNKLKQQGADPKLIRLAQYSYNKAAKNAQTQLDTLKETLEASSLTQLGFFEKMSAGVKYFGGQIKELIKGIGPLAILLTTIVTIITAIVKSFQAWKANSDSFLDKTIRQFEQLKATTSIFSKDFENYTKLFDRLANNQKYINSVEKQVLAIDNLNNSYKEYIKNQQAIIELERQESLQKSLFTGNVEAARRGLNTIINSLYEGKNAGWFAKLFKQQLGDIRGLFKGSTLSELSNFNFASLIGLSDDQLKQTATDLNTQLNKLLEEVAPYIEGVQTQLTLITGDGKKDKARKAQLERLLEAYNTYYQSIVQYQENANTAITGELSRRLKLQELAIEQKKNTLEIYNLETEGNKARIKDYDLTAEYFDRHLKYLTQMRDLTKQGSAEYEKYTQDIMTFVETFRRDFLEEFERNFRQIEKVPEEVDYKSEKLMQKTLNNLQENLDAWNQITGDERRLDLDWISTLDTAEFRAFKKLAGITFEVNRQFELLNETMSLFSQSSLGLGGQWSNVLGEMQQSFNSFSLAVAKGGEATFSDWAKGAANTFQMVGSFLNALSDEQDTQTEEGFKKQKAMQISATLVNMLGGIANAWASAMNPANAWMTAPGQIAIGTAMSTMIAGIGAAQIAKIAQTQFGSGASASGSAINSTIIPPLEYSSLVQSAQTEGAIKDTRVYVVESDIEGVGKKVAVQESENEY